MLTLAFDTSAAHCAAALLLGDRVLATRVEPMTRGQAERLMPLLEEMLAEADRTWSDLDRIGVGIGPGNFTGIRIAVSAARGLALALSVPAIGVSTFDAIHLDTPTGDAGVPAPRGQIHLCRKGRPPILCSAEDAPDAILSPPPGALATAMARIAALAAADAPRPAPLYIRPADAAPARDSGPTILDTSEMADGPQAR